MGELAVAEPPDYPSLNLCAAISLGGGAPILSGRPRGAELLAAVVARLGENPEPSATPLDLAGITFIDVSCADELLNKLLRRLRSGEMGRRYVFLQGGNPSVTETVETVLRLRGLSVLAKVGGDGIAVLGELAQPMREALDVLLREKALTSAELATTLGKNTNVVCNRLNALQRQGLACRQRADGAGGRRYAYLSIL